MYVPESFHLVHAWTCCALGYLFNGTLLWLIANRTEVEGRHYRPIFLLTTLVDLVYLAVNALVVPVLPMDGGLSAIVSLGPLGWVPQPFNFALAAVWVFSCMFSLCYVCVPFVYRYAVICRLKTEYGVRNFFAMLSVPTALSFGSVGLCFYAGYPWTEKEQQRGRELFFNESLATTSHGLHRQPYVVAYMGIDEAHNRVVTTYIMAVISMTYLLVFTCGWRIYRCLERETTTNLSAERARELNKQTSRTLLLQSLVPLVIASMPTFAVSLSSFARAPVGHFTIYQTAILVWAPVVNPMITMWVVVAYRREVSKWLACRRTATTLSAVVSPHQQQRSPT